MLPLGSTLGATRLANSHARDVLGAALPRCDRRSPEGSIQGSVLSKSDPVEPDLTPANTGNLTVPDPPLATS